jgi:hypothetical protein
MKGLSQLMWGATPLQLAVSLAVEPAVDLLLRYGANPTAPTAEAAAQGGGGDDPPGFTILRAVLDKSLISPSMS